MNARPILFRGDMVNTFDRKTQTRRRMKIQSSRTPTLVKLADQLAAIWGNNIGGNEVCACPYGQPGDLLWVRETWGVGCRPDPNTGWRDGIEYRADVIGLDENDLLPLYSVNVPDDVDLASYNDKRGWHPSIFMPRWASRFTLRITDVRVEQLQEISSDDCIAEGIEPNDCGDAVLEAGFNRDAYAQIWDAINGKCAPWSSNPWVWALTFEVIQKNVDEVQ